MLNGLRIKMKQDFDCYIDNVYKEYKKDKEFTPNEEELKKLVLDKNVAEILPDKSKAGGSEKKGSEKTGSQTKTVPPKGSAKGSPKKSAGKKK